MRKNLNLRQRLGSALIVLSAAVVLAGVVSGVVYIKLDHTNNELTRGLFKSQAGSRDLFEAAIDQETGVRGYLLNADPQYLQPYTDGSEQLKTIVPNFHTTSANRLIDQKADAAVAALTTWDTQFAQPVIAERRNGVPVTGEQITIGKSLFDVFRNRYSDLYSTILATRAHTTSRQHALLELLGALLAAAVVALLGVAGAVWLVLDRSVVKPVGKLLSDVNRVSQGDIDHVVKGVGPGEVVELGVGVDEMRKRIVGELLEVKNAQVELARSNSDLEQFAYVASHDLQEPLRKIASFCQLLEQRYRADLDDRGQQYIDFAVDGAKRMQRLINDLLAFSRVGRSNLEFEAVDLNQVVHDATDMLSATIQDTDAKVVANDLPVVDGESTLLIALFQNLIANAVKFHREGEHPVVDITTKDLGDTWQFAVKDNGIGIDPTYAERIFVIFQRLHGRDEYGGTGIGLAMCKKIVEYHSGTIWLDDQSSQNDSGQTHGTVFKFTLPKRQLSQQGATAPT